MSKKGHFYIRTHKERSQPQSGKKLGFLEKKKDYLKRSRDHWNKEKKLRKLKNEATFRNPEEFYFGMENKVTKDGKHVTVKKHLTEEEKKLVATRRISYINLKITHEQKKIERLRSKLHFLISRDEEKGNGENDGEEEENEKRKRKFNELPKQKKGKKTKQKEKKPRHIIYVDSIEEAKNFDAAENFETIPELMNRAYNRPKLTNLQNQVVLGNLSKRKKIESLRKKKYQELKERIARLSRLKKIAATLETEKNLTQKGTRKRVKKATINHPEIYKWETERKK
ncbi:u3 small nucleolar RNA-associated protein [Anaeramoeba flamelloides]|uniref:U3 small nucleolar RNA-associated protein 11 n=1 Tax=Anaeramoeba flamelloides TaxID=1746091 RepID=A0ABQ8Z3G0_9EUKA|nr:u3 small nucleolar RNA-associated protein [Anaeramoeba flamelloides]